MGTRTSYAPGTFCWVDLSTTDPEAAKRFYGEIFGWTYEDLHGSGDSPLAMIDGEAVAALVKQDPGELDAGRMPHWNNYVSVEDADATVAKARELGGSTPGDPFDVGSSRSGVIVDPVGAAVCVWQPGEYPGAGRVNETGCLTWNELGTADVVAATGFYTELFGWGTESMDTGDGPAYNVIFVGERSNGGIREQSPDEKAGSMPSFWLPYFAVESSDGTADKAAELGGSVLLPPTDMPNGGRIAALADPQGAAFAIWAGPLDD
jgi:predicted enzyme related to lactoylglutathione lyase